jgi:hypothetical protein
MHPRAKEEGTLINFKMQLQYLEVLIANKISQQDVPAVHQIKAIKAQIIASVIRL